MSSSPRIPSAALVFIVLNPWKLKKKAADRGETGSKLEVAGTSNESPPTFTCRTSQLNAPFQGRKVPDFKVESKPRRVDNDKLPFAGALIGGDAAVVEFVFANIHSPT
ncbi:hypothetical protein TWF106_008545 [Orbilia oligospora]|uniref:Uncharacterized protein n=1 Tax=Orbilia oligospora TaxID=2813651 RepID=A0A6G1M6B4_ORBOL|nr:hypothetical protein TWF788_006266 [Orbilia oligospora]KAF3199143.1 hypothetical protein TWF679_001598 [Orbilia oligospora]KAF3203344.1 hypothetical protein TWF191_002643 [Orbilia oligospora]KAF3216042.1 hypothetical protein TWF106_008545 [Orbilia oligospora]KAF3245299.1 hypothetical protein TWF192_007498 [Orbilia oligospora]